MNTKDIKNIKNVSDVQRVINANQVIWQGGTPLKDFPIGTKVVDPNTKYYGQPIVWIIADKNHEGYPANTVTLISEKILCLKALDAAEPSNGNSDRKLYGNNRYKYSNLLQWLNSDSNNWYSPQHGADAPPNSSNVNCNPYDSEPGFLNNFSSDFKTAMVSTRLKTARHDLDGGGSEDVISKIFLASRAEIGLDNTSEMKFPIFNNNASRKAYLTAESVSKNKSVNTELATSKPLQWWLRTPYEFNSFWLYIVYTDGSSSFSNANSGSYGIRPLCNVKDDSTFFEVIK